MKDVQGTIAAMTWGMGMFATITQAWHLAENVVPGREVAAKGLSSGFELFQVAPRITVGGLDLGFGFDQMQFSMQEYLRFGDDPRYSIHYPFDPAYVFRMRQSAYFTEE